ncbi:hypothetical protein M885DRAFT_441200, partial [Pelagophyceae sp. CCMP2097]
MLDAATLQPLKRGDPFLYACGLKWISDHFRCSQTGRVLDDGGGYYEHGGLPYCEDAYRDLFFTRRPACRKCHGRLLLDGSDGVRALGETWHMACYRCANDGACPTRGVFSEGDAFGDAFGHDRGDGRGALPYCEPCFRALWAPRCAACGDAVVAGNEACVQACGSLWHAEHFRCAGSGAILAAGDFIEFDGLPYAADEYYRRFGEMCHACGDVVTGDVVRVGDRAWHPDHFRC